MTDTRRAFLRALGGAAITVGVAGCTDTGNQGDGGGTEGGTGTATETTETATDTTETETETTETATETTETATDAGGTATGGNETGGNATGGGNETVEGSVGDQSQKDLKLIRHSYFERDGTSGVRGVVKNTSDTAYELVTVHVTPRADTGDESPKEYPEQQEAYRDTLAAGATWEFELVFEGSDVQRPDSYVVWVTGQKAS